MGDPFKIFLWLLGLSALSIELGAVEVGDTRSQLIEELGEPSSEAQAGNRSILGFRDGGRAVLIDGKVSNYSIIILPTPVPTVQHIVLHSAYTKDLDLGKFSWKKLLISAGFGLLAGLLSFRIFFTDVDDLIDCERYRIQPNWISWCRGEYWADVSSTARINIWLSLVTAAAVVAYLFLGAFDFLVK